MRPIGLGSRIDRDRPTTRSIAASGRSVASTRVHSICAGSGRWASTARWRSGRSWKRSIRAALAGGGEMLFYVRRHTCADGSFEWYVLNGHTRRPASKLFRTRAAAVAERGEVAGEARAGQGASPQANADADRPPKISHQRPPL